MDVRQQREKIAEVGNERGSLIDFEKSLLDKSRS